jgi:hypothetical protein
MAGPPDYRSEKMDSHEGRGRARGRWAGYLDQLDPSVVHAAFYDGYQAFGPNWAKETSELVGFWVAWHAAGGFEALEHAGWNRATIFRKVRRFRAVFGEHPDEYVFEWMKVDLKRFWDLDVASTLGCDDSVQDPDTE